MKTTTQTQLADGPEKTEYMLVVVQHFARTINWRSQNSPELALGGGGQVVGRWYKDGSHHGREADFVADANPLRSGGSSGYNIYNIGVVRGIGDGGSWLIAVILVAALLVLLLPLLLFLILLSNLARSSPAGGELLLFSGLKGRSRQQRAMDNEREKSINFR